MAVQQKSAQTGVPGTFAGLSPSAWQAIGIAAIIAAAFVLPFIVASYRVFQMTLIVDYAIALLGLNMLTGYNGQFSLGHGAFLAIGGYTAAILMAHAGVPYWVTIPAAGSICFIVGFLFGLPALRLQPLYLALATLALAVATSPLLKYRAFQHWTGGSQGILLNKPRPPFGLPITGDHWLYLFSLMVAIVLFWCGWNLLRGRIGRAIVAIRDQPIAAETMGINSALFKSLTFGVSAFYTGIAGALSAIAVQFVAPDTFGLLLSISLLVGSVIGGMWSIAGAVIGAVFIVFVPNWAGAISTALAGAIYGVFLIMFMYVAPFGIAGALYGLWLKVRPKLSDGTG